MDIANAVLDAFQIEHKEQLEAIRAFVGQCADSDTPDKRDIDEAYRMAHSLKGGARVCDLKDVETLAHDLEAVFSRVRDGSMGLDSRASQVIGHTLDAVEDYMTAVANQTTPTLPATAIAQLTALLEGKPDPSPASVSAPPEPAESPLAKIAPDDTAPGQAVETLRVRAEHIDSLLRSSDQLQTEGHDQASVAQQMRDIGHGVQMMQRQWEAIRHVAAGSLHDFAATAGFEQLERYLNAHGNHLRQLARQARQVRDAQHHSAWSLQRLGENLQRDVRLARMVTAASVYQGFRKMIRDLAQQAGKQVEYNTVGFDVEADRMVLQALKDPIMHLLRNSIAHGVESPEQRQAEGKSAEGHIRCLVEIVGSRLRITIDDDGCGVNVRNVVQHAIQSGIVTESQAAERSDVQNARLIFHPGFSTQQSADELAGRGIGLSVVLETVSRLQGDVQILPIEGGPGTRAVIDVPQSISTHRLLLVSCANQCYAVPTHSIKALRRVRQSQVHWIENAPVIRVDGAPISLTSLADLLGIRPDSKSSQATAFPVFIIDTGQNTIAVRVDALLAERNAVVKTLHGPAANIPTFTGGIGLSDGAIALVINPNALRTGAKASRSDQAAVTIASSQPQTSTVLIVDDSFTTRTLEKSILEAHGYDVRIAVDGVEALKTLEVEPVDLVISDVEMPNMDGFDLLKTIKTTPRLASIPVIMVTSCDKPDDRARGLQLGANAYVVKQRFDHQELLNVIRQCVGAPITTAA